MYLWLPMAGRASTEARYPAASERPRSAPAPSRPLRQASRRRAVALPRGAAGDAVAGIAAWRHPDNSSSGCRIPAAAAVRRQAGRPDLAAGRQFFCNERNPSAALQAPLPPAPPPQAPLPRSVPGSGRRAGRWKSGCMRRVGLAFTDGDGGQWLQRPARGGRLRPVLPRPTGGRTGRGIAARPAPTFWPPCCGS